jgi:hypothetical protein
MVLYTAPYIDLEILEEHAMERRGAHTSPTNEPTPRDIVCNYSQEDEPSSLRPKKSLNLWERQGHVRWLDVLSGGEGTLSYKAYW